MRRLTSCALVTMAVCMLVGGGGRAGADTVSFDYKWSATPGSVLASGTGSVNLALVTSGSTTTSIGALTVIDAANVTTTSSATSPPDSYNLPFALNLHLTDVASGQNDVLSFAGKITGELTNSSSSLVSTFTDPVTQWLHLGDYVYTVTIDPLQASLPAPGAQASTLLDAFVTVTQYEAPPPPPPPPPPPTTPQPPTPPATAPEPSSLVLGAFGMLAWFARRRKKS